MRIRGAVARLALGIALAASAGCQSLPRANRVPEDSSMLGVDVRFPFPLGRDPTLIRVYLAEGPIHEGAELPPIVSTTFVKGSRAYLLDPDPGTYSLVAVSFDYGPPLRTDAALGVTGVVASGSGAGETVVFPKEMIDRTRTTIGHGLVKFMGTLEVQRGERINAATEFGDDLQQAIAERISPGITTEAGLAGRFSTVWTLDRETSTYDAARNAEAFFRDGRADFGASPWAGLLPTTIDPRERRRMAALERAGAARPPAEVPVPEAAVAPTETAIPPTQTMSPPTETGTCPTETDIPRTEDPIGATAVAPPPVVIPELERDEPDLAPEPPRASARPVPAVRPPPPPLAPPGHPLAAIEIGMTHEDVEAILGEPDERDRTRTARAWIPFYTGPDAFRIIWLYTGRGQIVFTVDDGILEVIDVIVEGAE